VTILDEVLTVPSLWPLEQFKVLTTNFGGVKEVDYSGLPESLRDGMKMYLELGYVPGSFLTAVLENNLSKAVNAADSANMILLPRIVMWVYLQVPQGAWGSREQVLEWVRLKKEEIRDPRPVG